MKSFNFPTVGKRPSSKKDLDDIKKKQEEQAAAEAFEEYVAVFQDTKSQSSNKVWVKAGTYEAGKKHDEPQDKGKLYKPTSRFETPGGGGSSSVPEDKSDKLAKKNKSCEKKKSNLEIFKEELKIIQEEREERHRLKKMLGLQEVIKLPPKPGDDLRASLSLELDDVKFGSIDDGDPNTTNIYLGNLPTKISEQQLMEVFGKFGPLASVKVMWPRTDEEKARNRLSGFVAFMSRRDGERALKNLAGKEILGSEIKLGWGKAVPIPAFPVYIPPSMLELTMPPPLSGLPFNAQIDKHYSNKDTQDPSEFDRVLQHSTVKVVMPTDRILLSLIHRMVEFVIREGPMFEAMIMNKEIANPQFRFLFENQSPAHVYYRWKVYSILQGDSAQRWRTDDFRMFKNGSVWRPPKLNPFTSGMPDELIPEDERDIRLGTLSNAQRHRLERMLRRITPERHKVAEVMIFSIEHAESYEEISYCVKESLCNVKTNVTKKMARLYVINDVLHNCTAKGMNAFGYRNGFKTHLPVICQELKFTYDSCSSTLAESFKQRVLACFKAWDEWGVYTNEFVIKLQNIFIGIDVINNIQDTDDTENLNSDEEEKARTNLNKLRDKLHRRETPRAQMPPKSALNLVKSLQSAETESDLDGIPYEEEASPDYETPEAAVLKFKPSKWETVDPEDVKAQAVTTTSKWDLFENSESNLVDYDDEDIDGVPMDDQEQNIEQIHRNQLRNIEMKVLAFQDQLDQNNIDYNNIVVQDYRNKLLKRAMDPDPDAPSEKQDDSSPRRTKSKRDSRRSRSRSPSGRKRSLSSKRRRSSKR